MNDLLPHSARGRVAAVTYVLAVTGLAAFGMTDPSSGRRWPCYLVAMAATLPALVPLLPYVYVGGGTLWNLSGADRGGPQWIVTLGYALMATVIAVVNAGLLSVLSSRRRARRQRTRSATAIRTD